MPIPLESLPNPPVRDACAERIFGPPDPVIDELLDRPITRRLIVQRAGRYRDTHRHRVEWPAGENVTVLWVCTTGSGRLRVAGREHWIVPGTAFVMLKDVPYAYVGRGQPWTLWWCSLVGTEVEAVVRELGMTPDHPVASVGNPERLVATIEEVISTYRNLPSTHDAIEASGFAWQLLSRLEVGRGSETESSPVVRTLRYLEERFRTDVQIPELADVIGVPVAKLGALFRDATGSGVLSYLIGLRMAEARRLLDDGDAGVAEIARSVGYSDPSYFSRQFTLRHGVSPSEYRARHDPPRGIDHDHG